MNHNSDNRKEIDFPIPILGSKVLAVTDIDGARTIVYQAEDGTIYHQDCSTPHPKGVGYSYCYVVV